MLKQLLFLLALCAFNLTQSQVLTQLTHFEDNAFQAPTTKVFNFQDQVFYAFENDEEEIEIWEFADQVLSLVYKTPFRLCDFDLYLWRIYENKIIIAGYRSFRFIDFLTGEMTEEIFSNEAYFIKPSPNYGFDNSLIKFKTPDQVDHVYDIELEDFVPVFDGDLLYKSTTSYYYFESNGGGRFFKKRPFFETQDEIIVDNFSGLVYRIYNDTLYFSANGVIYKVDGDSIDEFPLFNVNIVDLFLAEDGLFYAIEFSSPNRFLHVLSSDLVLLESKEVGNYAEYSIVAVIDDKVFFRHAQVSGLGLAFWDMEQDTIIAPGLTPFLYGLQAVDSLIFNGFGYHGTTMEVLNTHTLDIKTLDLPPFRLNEIDNQRIFKKDDDYFVTLYDDENGFGFYEYDFQNNEIAPTTAFLQKNYGTGSGLQCTGETLYIPDFNKYSRQIKIYDPDAADGIYVHEIAAPLDGDIAVIEGKFYYFLDHDFGGIPPSDSNYVDLVVFDPVAKTTATVLEAFSYTPLQNYAKYLVSGRYILLPYYFDSNNFEVFDTKNNVQFTVTPLQKELLKHISTITDNFMYAKDINSGGLYKMEIDDLYNYELIHPGSTSQPRQITEDAVTFWANDSLFYYDGQALKNYFFEDVTFYHYDEYISPDKRYVAYTFIQNGTSGIVVYDHEQDLAKKILAKVDFAYFLPVYFSQEYMFYFDQNSNDDYQLFSYHLATEALDSVVVSTPDLLSLYNGEVHIENVEDATISIYDYELQPVDVVPSGGLFNFSNNLNFPRFQALNNPRVIYSNRTHGSSNSNNKLINLYNAAERTVTSYFDCDSGLRFHNFVQKDSVLYCLASNDTEGYQIYKIDIENYVTDVKNGPQALEISELLLFPNPTTEILYFNKKYDNILIYNATGQLVLDKKDPTDMLTIKHLYNGMYFIKANFQNEFYNGKFVKAGGF